MHEMLSLRGEPSSVRGVILDVHSPKYLIKGSRSLEAGDIAALRTLCDRGMDAGIMGFQLNPMHDSGMEACNYLPLSLASLDPTVASLEDVPPLQDCKAFTLLQQQWKNAGRDAQRGYFQHGAIRDYKLQALRIAYTRTMQDPAFRQEREEIERSLETADRHLCSYAFFLALTKYYESDKWWMWPQQDKCGDVEAVTQRYRGDDIGEEARFLLFTQRILERQWQELSAHVRARGGFLAMDKPIYPQYRSADVWANQELFYMHPDGMQSMMAGCCDAGGRQVWGNAVYRWQEEPDKVIRYFLDTVRHMTKIADVIRLDHAMAMVWKYYLVDARDPRRGTHREALKGRLLGPLMREFPHIRFIAEDTGIPDSNEPYALLDQFGIPGMRSPAWADQHTLTPHHADIPSYPRNTIGVLDNHDLPTVPHMWRQWFANSYRDHLLGQEARPLHEEEQLRRYCLRVMASNAHLIAITLRSVIGDDRQYNYPGQLDQRSFSLRSPHAVEAMDFEPLSEMMRETKRVLRIALPSSSAHVA